MGKMKDLYMDIMDANNGIPEGLTMADFVEMNKQKIYNKEAYEKYLEEKEKILILVRKYEKKY